MFDLNWVKTKLKNDGNHANKMVYGCIDFHSSTFYTSFMDWLSIILFLHVFISYSNYGYQKECHDICPDP